MIVSRVWVRLKFEFQGGWKITDVTGIKEWSGYLKKDIPYMYTQFLYPIWISQQKKKNVFNIKHFSSPSTTNLLFQ